MQSFIVNVDMRWQYTVKADKTAPTWRAAWYQSTLQNPVISQSGKFTELLGFSVLSTHSLTKPDSVQYDPRLLSNETQHPSS